MAEDIGRLIAHEGWVPDVIIGHSAGGAIALQLALILPHAPRALIGLNAALGKFDGIAALVFPVMAKALALTPLTAAVFALAGSSEAQVRRLILSTGSRIDNSGIACYRTLVRDRDHVDATLLMMSQWTLDHLLMRLPEIKAPTLFIVGVDDRAVPPSISVTAAASMPVAEVFRMPGLGHLSHEEAPQPTCAEIEKFLSSLLE